MKTIISANIPVTLASRLKDKTKGTRSRVITRALTAYLDEKEAYNMNDLPIEDILMHLFYRDELTDMQKTLIRQMYLEMKE
ncbi:MAG: hypothetical protein ACXABD_21920 [Candidatus Thorarchaeota archaeon]|jgi:metal-responsive CopG/Arc/MetJ family transcriptional regulator